MTEYVFTLNDTTPRVEITVEPVAAAVADDLYQRAKREGFAGTFDDFLAKFKGEKGDDGLPGNDGRDGLPGADGVNGRDGENGKSAYEIAVEQGFLGDESAWLLSLKGDAGQRGEKGEQGEQGAAGRDGEKGERGEKGADGQDGKSAYEIAVEQGFIGDKAAWLLSLKGERGLQGLQGLQGIQGVAGQDGAQGLPGERGLQGERGIQGLPGKDGADGKSAYQVAVANGFSGDEAAWLLSLKGEKGEKGDPGSGGSGTDTTALQQEIDALKAVVAKMPKYKEYQAGYIPRAAFVGTPANNGLVTANYPKPFSGRPILNVTLDIADAAIRAQYVNNATETGFQVGTNFAGSLNGVWYEAFILEN